jgi:DDE_Tnp_1-associated
VPDPRSPLGRWHPLEFVLAGAVCAFTAAGHDSPLAIADWAAGCSQETLAVLGGRRDPWTRMIRPPCERTFRRVLASVDETAVNDAVHGWLAAVPQAGPGEMPGPALREREQRRAAAAARKPDSQVHLLSAFHVGEGHAIAQREVGAKTNEIPRARPVYRGPGPDGYGRDPGCAARPAARGPPHLRAKGRHY